MAETAFVLCALMSSFCAFALTRGYLRTRNRLLLWSSLCFALLAFNNIFACVDLLILPDTNLNGPFWRSLLGAVAGFLLLFGLIWEVA